MQRNSVSTTQWAGWLMFGLVIVWLNRYTHWDTELSRVFFDTQSNTFPIKQNRLVTLIFHEGLRWITAALWLGLLILALLPKSKGAVRLEITHLLVVSLLAALAVSLLKSGSAHSCPWDLAQYGGTADYNRLFEDTGNSGNAGPGKCFPSGHASTAFMWIVLLYSPLPWLANRRRWIGMLLLSAGLLASGVQIMKGAHFLSHVLATAWVCWGIALICRKLHNIKA